MTTGDVYDIGPPWWRSMRYRIAFIGFFGMANCFIQRSNLSMGIVCMVNHTAVDIIHHQQLQIYNNISYKDFRNTTITILSNSTLTSEEDDGIISSCTASGLQRNREDGQFVWSKQTQGLLLGALYWGYVGMQMFGGYIVKMFGIRRTVGPCMVVMSCLTILTHAAALLSPWVLFALRILVGVGNAVFLPGIYFIFTLWAPPEEKGRLTSIIFSGVMFSNVIVFPVSAMLCDYGFAGGWPSIFYLSGLCNLLWCIAWFMWVYDSPIQHPSIHPKEREYIISSLNLTSKSSSRKDTVPWCKVFTSLPAISIICAQFALNWGFHLMLNTLPLYMREVLKFDIQSNGVFTMLPYISMWLILSISGYISDYFVKRFGASVLRKSAAVCGLAVPAMLIIGISYLDCQSIPLVMTLLCLALGLMALNWIGSLVNFMDIAPKYAGTLMTYGNTISMTSGLIAPYVVAEFTVDNTREQWQKVFFLTAGVMCFGTLMFVIFGKGTVQTWAMPEKMEIHIEEEEQLYKL